MSHDFSLPSESRQSGGGSGLTQKQFGEMTDMLVDLQPLKCGERAAQSGESLDWRRHRLARTCTIVT